MRRFAWLLAVPLIPLVQQRVDSVLPDFKGQQHVLDVWSGERLRRLAPGFEDLLADIYWLRTVQYFGAQRLFSTEKRFELLEPLIDTATRLDPRLEVAYRYGAIFLCEPWPVGKGDPRAGVRLLERGVQSLPRSWRLRQDLGYFRFIFLDDAAGGARVLQEAARLPGAPFFLDSLAASVLTQGGDRATARAAWQRMYEQAEAGLIRDNARYNLQRLDALDRIDALEALVQRYRTARGGLPPSAAALAQAVGLPPAELADPAGQPFTYDPARGRFWFNAQSRFWRPDQRR